MSTDPIRNFTTGKSYLNNQILNPCITYWNDLMTSKGIESFKGLSCLGYVSVDSVYGQMNIGMYNSGDGYPRGIFTGNGIYQAWNPRTNPSAFLVTIQKLSDYITSSYPYLYTIAEYSGTSNVDQLGHGKHGTKYDRTVFLDTYKDYYVVNSVKLYDNTADGTYSDINKRPLVSNTPEVYLRYMFTGFNNSSFTRTIEGDGYFPIIGGMLAPTSQMLYPQYPYSRKLMMQNITGQIDVIFSQDVNLSGTEISSSPNKWVKAWSLTGLTKFLNYLKIPFAYNVNEIQQNNSDTLPDYHPPGQPDDKGGGGTGNGDNETDDIELPTPTITALNSLNRQYAMTQSMLATFSDFLWNGTFLDNIKLLWKDPTEGVINCRMFPFSIVAHDGSGVGTTSAVTIGNVDTTATGYPILSDYNMTFDLGSIEVTEYYGSSMDYSPYTNISIYLPYIGIKDLDATLIMGKTLSVKYIVDITTGACIAQIFVGGMLLFVFEGKIGVEIPISSSNASQVASSNAISAVSAGAGIAIGASTGGIGTAVMAGSLLSGAKSVASNRYHINKGGVNSAQASLFMPQYCYLIIERPIKSRASNFASVHGFPCNMAKKLSTLTGYTKCNEVVLNNIGATQQELSEIKSLLETGVIIK